MKVVVSSYRHNLQQIRIEILWLSSLVFIYALLLIVSVFLVSAYARYDLASLVINIGFFISTFIVLAGLVFNGREIFITPLWWFLFTQALCYGFGPLVYFWGSPATIERAQVFFRITNEDLYEVNFLIIIGSIMVLLTYLLLTWSTRKANRVVVWSEIYQAQNSDSQENLYTVAKFLMMIGIPSYFLIVVPSSLNLVPWIVPGVIKLLAYANISSLFVLYILRSSTFPYVNFLFYSLTIGTLFFAFLSLSKFLVVIVVIVLLVAALIRGANLYKAAAFGIIMILFYGLVLTPVVTYARIIYGAGGAESISSMVTNNPSLESGTEANDFYKTSGLGVQSWWLRLNYASSQSFAIQQFNDGYSGESISDGVWIFIPRSFYSDKPNFSTQGTNFNGSIDGNFLSSSSPTYLVEGYWNYGWLGVVLVGIMLGIVFFGWRIYIDKIFARRHLYYLPVVINGLLMGMTQDGWLILNCLAPLPIVIFLHYFFKIAFQLFVQFKLSYIFGKRRST